MNTHQAIRMGIEGANMITMSYLNDLTDADLLVRAIPGTNHIAWQLGHLIASEHKMVEMAFPGSMPKLPDGFAEKYTTETSGSDAPEAFLSKSAYLNLYEEQRSGTLNALAKVSDADLDKPVPEPFREWLKSIGELFSMQGTHWLMHVGQWAIIRRKLGRKPLF